MNSMQSRKQSATYVHQLPLATISVLVLVGVVTGLQFKYPTVLAALRRDPIALAKGQWWRLLSPLLVHADGALAWIFNSVGLALVGPVVEHRFGRWRWLLLFLVGGLAGNIAGYAWEPYGAGTSVGVFGLVGGLLAWLLVRGERVWSIALTYIVYIVLTLTGQVLVPGGHADLVGLVCALAIGVALRFKRIEQATLGIIVGIMWVGMTTLNAFHDNHGPPMMIGACVAAVLLRIRAYDYTPERSNN